MSDLDVEARPPAGKQDKSMMKPKDKDKSVLSGVSCQPNIRNYLIWAKLSTKN